MCYGSGCRKELSNGDCSVWNYEPYRNTEFYSPCVMYGCFKEVMSYYLAEDEYDELFIGNNIPENKKEKIIELGWERWYEDEDRKKAIKEIEKLPQIDR